MKAIFAFAALVLSSAPVFAESLAVVRAEQMTRVLNSEEVLTTVSHLGPASTGAVDSIALAASADWRSTRFVILSGSCQILVDYSVAKPEPGSSEGWFVAVAEAPICKPSHK